MADDGLDESDIEALRITRDESRAVLDHQLATLNDLDDKAMRTVRTDVLLLGILGSAVGIAGPERVANLSSVVQAFSIIAGACLFISAILGTAVYVVSDLTYGIGPTYREEIHSEAYPEREWLETILQEYDAWTQSMAEINENNAYYLTITQGLLGAGLVFLLGATSLLTVPLYFLPRMADSKSGRELEPEVGHKGPRFARKFFGFFGIGMGVDDESEE